MNKIGLEYGKWLAPMKWNYIATLRPHYKLNMYNSDKKMQSLSKYKMIDKLFFVLENDRDGCPINHIHLMLKTNTTMSRDLLAKALSVNPKAVGFFQEVTTPEAISYYCTKNLTKKDLHYNFFYKN